MLYISHMIRTQIYLPKHLYQNMQLIAQRENKSVAEVIRELLNQALSQETEQHDAGKTLLALAKLGGRGPADLSVNLDNYLYGE